VFTEKPVDLSYERVVACLQEVEKHQVPFMVGFQRRFDPTFRALKKALAADAIGEVEMVRITSRDPYPPPASYVASSGGLFRDMMIHDFDMARWLLGEEPVEVYATGSSLVSAALDSAICVLKTASGKLCHIENSRRAVYGYDQRVEVLGAKGALQAGNVAPTALQLWNERGLSHEKPQPFFPERYVEAYALEMQHFVEAIDARRAPEVSGDAGRLSLLLADAAQKSFDTKVPVHVS
jgi:myo-inositol 2-dehydrogenase/D-chiro-inositol 1-dehydrogenase